MHRIIGAALCLTLATGIAACSDSSPSAPDERIPGAPAGIVVSNATASSARFTAIGAGSSLAGSASSVAYVSAPPGAYPTAVSVDIRNETKGGTSRLVTVIDGGFDPVGIDADEGDDLSLSMTMVGGGSTVVFVKVPRRRPPVVVRTSPSQGRIDVALNVQVEIVFSEPVDASSVNASSLALRRAANDVSAKVQVSPDGLGATLIPDSPLEPLTTYSLNISGGIRDLEGDPLGEPYVVSFTTSVATIPGALQKEDIVYTADVEGDNEIFITRSDGGFVRRLTVRAGTDGYATWSPDGSRIAYVSLRGIQSDIYVIDADGSNEVQLTKAPGGNYQPAWSPDGERIAFMSTRDGRGQIYLINADGSDEKRMTLPFGAQSPAWSPDGKQLVFARGGTAPIPPADIPGLWLMNSDGTNLRQITHDPNATPPYWTDMSPSWSADGTRIVFSRQATLGYRDLFVVKVDGTGLTQLTYNRNATHPTWSPDGEKIAFSAWTGFCSWDYPELNNCSAKILTMPADRGPELVVAVGTDPSWRR